MKMNENNNICPICGEGQLHERVVHEETEYKEQKSLTPLYFSECDVCGSEQASAAQTRANKRAMIAFRKQVDGLLTGAEVRKIRERLRISQAEAAKIFGGGPVAFSKYESDDVTQSESMDKLLRLAASDLSVLEKLKMKAGLIASDEGDWIKGMIEKPGPKRRVVKTVSISQPQTTELGWRKSA